MSPSKQMNRRQFLRRTSGIAAGALAAPLFVSPSVVGLEGKAGANEQIALGFIGSGGRARLLMSQTPAPGRIVAICDCYVRRCEEAIQEKKEISSGWDVYQDYRKLLDRRDIDAVIVPTTDHGRVRPCIHACQAGKDIYAEKPLTLTVAEGRALVRAVEKYGRVFQTGSQQRSMEYNRYPCELVRTGRIGKVIEVLACNYTGPGVCENLPEQPMPEGLDWDMWCGQTRLKPYNQQLQFGWMGCRDYSGGEMTNWGAHGLDQVQWALGADDTGPVEIWPQAEGPHGQIHMRYASGVLVKLELWGQVTFAGREVRLPLGGAIFVGEKGKMYVERNTFIADPPELAPDPPEPQKREMWEGPGWQAKFHIGNWLDCIRTRRRPVSDAEVGHRSITVCHLANIAREVGRKLRWDPAAERFVGDPEADAYLARPRRKGHELPDLS
ncbi:MAG: Gfo/Idh/MocA family oxidoreductase [Planctomycetes bacterium]|nr:Gfo/Idh/MocA family oxidoreductase [Planctomycetota bacterium]